MDVSGLRRMLVAGATVALTALGAVGPHSHGIVGRRDSDAIRPLRAGQSKGPGVRARRPSLCRRSRQRRAGMPSAGTRRRTMHRIHERCELDRRPRWAQSDIGEFSVAGKEGSAATGIDGISFDNDGGLFAIETGSTDIIPQSSPGVSQQTLEMARAQIGRLIELRPGGRGRGAEWSHPNGRSRRSRTSVTSTSSGASKTKNSSLNSFPTPTPTPFTRLPASASSVDAASNTLDEVRADGSIRSSCSSRIQVPRISPPDSVPTCIARGPDGAFYIGELTGAGNGPGTSKVWRVVEGQEQPQEWASGLTAVTGCGFGSDGQFYATEFSTLGFESFAPGTGAVVRVPPHSTAPIPVVSNTPGHTDSPLSFPNGFAAGPNGGIYVSNWSILPSSQKLGQVVRISQ